MTSRTIFIEAPARLHFGVLDLAGTLGRRFGGLGAGIPAPSLLLEASAADTLAAKGPGAERVLEFARRFRAAYAIQGGAHFTVHREIPPHAGLGSGTQLGLAVGRALAELHGLSIDPLELARAVGRGARSAIGTWVFARGGFILEGGRRPGSDAVAPLLARHPMPPAWQCVVAIPRSAPGLSGEAEADAFRTLPAPPITEVERVAHLVLMQLLPALVDADLDGFGGALSEIQRITGGWFAPTQGGIFAPGPTESLIGTLADAGARGVGQSSWGPTAYAIADTPAEATRLAALAAHALGPGARIFHGPFATSGARIWWSGGPLKTD